MLLSDLQSKDVISLKDGKRLGRIVDAMTDNTGVIEYLVIEEKKFWFFSKSNETNIYFKDINKIGEDVILVDIL